jgi:hypothetical protein
MPRGRPLLRRLRLPFRHECMPNIHGWCRNGGSNAGFRLTKAVPCHWTIAAVCGGADRRTRTPCLSLTRRVLYPMS